jgi:hypothetical protein
VTSEQIGLTTDELEQMTFQYLPEAFFKRALKAVFLAHRLSWEECSSAFAIPEAENVQPYHKRGKLEGYLRDIAESFPGVSSRVVRAEQSNWFHTEVMAGPVILTENAVPTPCALVEKADFRVTLAKSAQGTLFPDERVTPDSPLYLLLLHSKSRWETEEEQRKYRHLPGSAYIAYPAPKLDHYVHDIDLFARFPDVVAEHMPAEWNHEAQLRYVSRARRMFGT